MVGKANMEFFLEPLQHDFMRSALEVAVVLSFLCGALGVLLVPRGLSMLGDGLAHATFGGVGIALLAGALVEDASWYALPFAVAVALGIAWTGRHTKIASDAALGVFFAVSLALGIAALHIASHRGVGVDIEAVLFGNILGIQPQEVALISVVGVCLAGILIYRGPRIAYAGFYPDLASMSGIRVAVKEYLLMALTAVVTVLAVRAVGVMLVSAWLVIPATIGRQLSRRLGPMFMIAVVAAIFGSVIGLMASYYYDIPGGAAMTLSLGILFLLAVVLRGLKWAHG